MESIETVLRKITNKNLNTGNGVLYPEEMAAYYKGELKKVTFTREDGSPLESYYGAGLRKLVESARAHKSGKYLLVKRHFATKVTSVEG